MVSKRTGKRLALGGVGLGLANVALIVFQIWTYEHPDDGGTSAAGLFFFFALVVAVTTLLEGLVGWAVLRRRPPSPWVHRLTTGGLVLAVGHGLVQVGWNLVAVLQLDLGVAIPPAAGFALLGLLVLGVLGIGLGSLVEIGRSVHRKFDADAAD